MTDPRDRPEPLDPENTDWYGWDLNPDRLDELRQAAEEVGHPFLLFDPEELAAVEEASPKLGRYLRLANPRKILSLIETVEAHRPRRGEPENANEELRFRIGLLANAFYYVLGPKAKKDESSDGWDRTLPGYELRDFVLVTGWTPTDQNYGWGEGYVSWAANQATSTWALKGLLAEVLEKLREPE